ncbi:MAG: ATP-binding protein [Candidatus Eremiobacteraeota bacterium]|nr:ATP-binding protein [Candidatus Eremiobacteraeota bacterium]MBC5827752.1 ATP-binding protein [Candidatus Eremiobacteraeota bacterium]
MKVFQRHFCSEYGAVGEARRAIAHFARECGFDSHEISHIALAVGEACNNAVEHGHVVGASFKVEALFDRRKFEVKIEDSGGGFELSGKGKPVEPQERGTRGLGIFLMRAIMDDVDFDCGQNGTTVTLTKCRDAKVRRFENAGKEGSCSNQSC